MNEGKCIEEGAAARVVQPIMDTALPAEQTQLFDMLMDEIYDLSQSSQSEGESEEACAALCNHIQEEITRHPILAETVATSPLGWSILTALCEKTSHILCRPAIKLLIETNPHALVWQNHCGANGWTAYPIYSIAQDINHCVLMPWIAEHYVWGLGSSCLPRTPTSFGSCE